MDNFIVSARKYRPSTFDSVVGQSHITHTLKNAIANNQLAQAFLFCGPRGVGKTTCARILAKTINCENLTADTEACGTCNSCQSYTNGASFTIHELDAASNNSVEDIRNLIDQVRIPPQSAKYKIYIIDEVHMLSTQAFNAFLKTLEEPPKYAIFILATTEKHKILPTILSRCQIFDFNRIRVEDMSNHLESIAIKENIPFEKDALFIIAEKADGGLRDALSMFDQISSFSNRNITYKSVVENLNILDYDFYFSITQAIHVGNSAEAIIQYNEILSKGFEGSHFIAGLAMHFRNLLLCKEPKAVSLLEVSDNVKKKYIEQSSQLSSSFLLSVLNIANQAEIHFKNSKNQNLQVELALMKMAHVEAALNIKTSPEFQSGFNGNGGSQNEILEKKKLTNSSEGETSVPTPLTRVEKIEEKPLENPQAISQDKPQVNSPGTPLTSLPSSSSQKEETNLTSKEEENNSKPAVKKGWGNVRLGGISSASEKNSEEVEPTLLDGDEKTEFTQEQFLEVWHDLATEAKGEGKINIFTILTANPPALQSDFTIEVIVENQIQMEVLNEYRYDLVNALRTRLKNFSIDIKPRLETLDIVRKPYTSAEKFQALLAKNPVLDQFRQTFNLGLD